MMWNIKVFKSKEKFLQWIEKNADKMQWHEVFVNNAYAVQYKPLLVIDIN